MKRFLNTITMGNVGVLKKTLWLEVLKSVFQGQPYFVILMMILELLRPLLTAGAALRIQRMWLLFGWLAASLAALFFIARTTFKEESETAYTLGSEGRLSLGAHLKKLSMGFFKGHDPGDITALMLQDYANVETMLSHLLMDALGALFTPFVFLAFLAPYNWQMTLVTMAPIPAALLMAALARKIVEHTGKKHIKTKNEAASRMLEYLEGIKCIKAHNLHGEKFSRLKNTFRRLKNEGILLEATGGPTVILAIWVLNGGIALIMLISIRFLLAGTLDIPTLLFFIIVGTRMYDPLSKFLISFVEMNYFAISAKRIDEIQNEKPLPEPSTPSLITRSGIEFKDVTFRYHNTDVLKKVNFTLKENTMTALVGPSGSGKTTITRLIARFWDVDSGEIRIGGKPVTEYSADNLMSRISIVFQDVYLFNDTILNNFKVGRSNASVEDIRDAARRARCLDFIEALPNGFDTLVGEGGATLSGGEKQRLSIARAILKDAPIILLDEATASLDPENELFIQEAIDELIRGRTLIVIAHKLSTITHANQILVLDNGSLVESGSHKKLLKNPEGLYRSMWEEQKKAHTWKVTSNKPSDAPATVQAGSQGRNRRFQ